MTYIRRWFVKLQREIVKNIQKYYLHRGSDYRDDTDQFLSIFQVNS